jgi:uncharacterized protein (TIGR00369 family)
MNEVPSRQPQPPGDVPVGFRPLKLGGTEEFIGIVGPLYGKREGTEMGLGFRVERRHCNPIGICHGGMLSTFADMTMAIGANVSARIGRFLPTVNLASDFLAPAPLGSWVEGRGQILRITRSLVFTQCVVTADGTPAVRSSAILKLGQPFPADFEAAPNATE